MLDSFKPMDIVLLDGLWYMPHHWLIKWRSLDPSVHCLVIKDESGNLYNPIFTGIKTDGKYGHISHYAGRNATIMRFKSELDVDKMLEWCERTVKDSDGYDFLGQWLLGFVCGIATKKLADNPKAWTCAEFPYWAFQECGYKLTEQDEVLPMPRLFRFNSEFEIVYQGKL